MSTSSTVSTVLRRRRPSMRPAPFPPPGPRRRQGNALQRPEVDMRTAATSSTSNEDAESGPSCFDRISYYKNPPRQGSKGHFLGVPFSAWFSDLGQIKRSDFSIDDRPLHVSALERYVRFCETTHIHGCQPCHRIAVVGWFYRFLYLSIICCGVTCAAYFIKEEYDNFQKDIVELSFDFEQATSADLFFPQVVVCNNNFIQASFLEEFNITKHSDLLIEYYFTGSRDDITEADKDTIKKIEEMTLARRVAGALLRFGDSTNVRELLEKVENKSKEELLKVVQQHGMPTPLPLVTGMKPGFRNILRATYNFQDRDPNYMAPLYPTYRTDLGWCSLIIPMVEFMERYKEDNFQVLREKRAPRARRGVSLGKAAGLRLLVDAEIYDYSFGFHGAEGFQMGVVSHRNIPLMFLEDTQVRPGSLTNVVVKPFLTKVDEGVKERFLPTVRQCYFQNEVVTDKSMGIGGSFRHRYTINNCHWQGTVNHATETCGCKIWNYGESTKDLGFCHGENLTCFRSVLKDFGKFASFTDNKNRSYNCFNDCESYTHSISTNSGSYPNPETFLYDLYDYCSVIDKMAMSCKDEYKRERLLKTTFNCSVVELSSDDVSTCVQFIYSYRALNHTAMQALTDRFRKNVDLRRAVWNYSSSNVAQVNVYFNDINVPRLVRKEAYKVPAFFAAIGGLLGLAMGMSFITLFEAAYLVIRLFVLLTTHVFSHWGVPSEGISDKPKRLTEKKVTPLPNEDKYNPKYVMEPCTCM